MNKWLIHKDKLVWGDVGLHYELITDDPSLMRKSECKGGGIFVMDEWNKRVIFFGRSIDFGASTIKDFRMAWENRKFNDFDEYDICFSTKLEYRTISQNDLTKINVCEYCERQKYWDSTERSSFKYPIDTYDKHIESMAGDHFSKYYDALDACTALIYGGNFLRIAPKNAPLVDNAISGKRTYSIFNIDINFCPFCGRKLKEQ